MILEQEFNLMDDQEWNENLAPTHEEWEQEMANYGFGESNDYGFGQCDRTVTVEDEE